MTLSMRAPFVALFLTAMLITGSARALDPLPLSAPEAVNRLSPLLQSGELILLEATPGGAFEQATVFGLVPVSAASAFSLIADPANYGRMSPSVEKIEVHERKESGSEYTSTLNVPFGTLTTRTRMRLQPPDVIETGFVGGDLKIGQFRWQFVPTSAAGSCAVYTLKTDIRESSWVMKQLVSARPEMQFGGNAGTGLITVWGLRRLTLNRPATTVREPSPWANRAVEFPRWLAGQTPWRQLTPLLERGPLVHVESTPGGRLKRVTVFGLVRAPEQRVYDLVAKPEGYTGFMSNLKSVQIESREGDKVRYTTGYDIMMLRYNQVEEISLEPHVVHQRVVSGDLQGSASQLELLTLGDRTTLLVYSFYLDPTRSGWMMKKIFALDPLIEHVMAVSGGLNIYLGLSRAAEKGAITGTGARG